MSKVKPVVRSICGVLVVSSRNLADVLGVKHKDVMAEIRRCLKRCNKEFAYWHFREAEYPDQEGELINEFFLTINGLALFLNQCSFGSFLPNAILVKYLRVFREKGLETPLMAVNVTNYGNMLVATCVFEPKAIDQGRDLFRAIDSACSRNFDYVVAAPDDELFTVEELADKADLFEMSLTHLMVQNGLMEYVGGSFYELTDKGADYGGCEVIEDNTYELKWPLSVLDKIRLVHANE